MRRTTALAATLMTAAASLIVTVTASAPAQAAISCSTTTGSSDFYPGPSASAMYDARFSQGPAVRGLSTHVPQGITYWGAQGLVLTSGYSPSGGRARIYAMTTGGTAKGEVEIYPTHAGGIAVAKDWLYVSGGGSSVRWYRLSELRTKFGQAGIPYLAQAGSQNISGNSFLTSYNGSIWAGTFNETGRGTMYEYSINANGSLTRKGTAWEVPTKTQGVTVTSTHFIYSTSYGRNNRSNIYVVRRTSHDLDASPLRCFRAPSMSEGVVTVGSTVYVVYESGAAYYANASDKPVNIIKHLHKASLSRLTSLA